MFWMLFRIPRGSKAVRRPVITGFKPSLEALEDRLAPSAGAPHFAVIGQYGLAGANEQAVANLVKTWNPDFILTVGGNNLPSGAASTIDANVGQYYSSFIAPYHGTLGTGATTNAFYPSLGSHDWDPGNITAYTNYFTSLPGNQRYYTFAIGPVQFFALDGNYQEPDGRSSTSVQAQWLQQQLAASTATWKIVYLENPPYSSGASNPSTTVMQWPFQQWGATAVISGRAPDYERVLVNNFPYFVEGLGGWTLGQFASTPVAGSQVRYNANYGAMLVDASANQLTFQFINVAGATIDTYTINAPGATVPAAPTNLVATAASSSQINLTWTNNAANQTGVKIERSTDGTNFTLLTTVAASATSYSDTGLTVGTTYYYRVRATNSAGDSSPSNVVSASPLASAGLRFAAIAEYGTATQPEQDVANLVHSWNPDLIITAGDNNYPVGAASTIDQNIGQYYHDFIAPYKGAYGAGATVNKFFPTIGDHDEETANAAPYLNYFTLPGNGRYYTFTQGPVQFFALDPQWQEPDGRTSTSIQGQWLQQQLAASTATYKIVYFELAPYTSSTWVANTTVMQWPFKQWGATAVIDASVHDYERIQVGGLTYLSDGLGGTSGSTFANPIPGSQVRFGSDFGALLVDANSDHITFQFITRAGVVIDAYTIYSSPTSHPAAAPTNLVATAASMNQMSLTWVDNSSNETGFKIERSADGVNFTQIAQVGADVTTYTDSNLAANTKYYYRVRATNGLGDSAYTNISSDTTGALPGPTNLVAAVISSSQINLSWTNNTSSATGYQLQRSTDGVAWTQIAALGSTATSYSVTTGLYSGGQFFFRVRAVNATGNSAFSNVGSTHTAAPGSPGNLAAAAVSSSQVQLNWSDNSNNETGFYVESSPDGTNFTQVATLGPGSTTYTVAGLSAGTKYYFRVRAYNGIGTSNYSNVANVVTTTTSAALAVATAPAAPSNLVAVLVSASRINLNWSNNDTSVTGFKIERSTDGVNFTQIATVSNVTSYSDTSIAKHQTYYYRVRAYNPAGDSLYSNLTNKITT